MPQFIENLYFKRFGKTKPDRVVSIEDCAKEIELKKEKKRERKRLKGQSETGPTPD